MMKHNLRIIAYLMVLFFTTQIVGLYLLNQSIETVEQTPEGDIEVVYSQPITGRPELEGQSSFSYILAMVLVGTAILLVIIKLRLFRLWKLWFFLAIWGALSISFSVFLDDMLSAIISFVLAYIKIYKPNAQHDRGSYISGNSDNNLPYVQPVLGGNAPDCDIHL